jgi:N-acetyl-gamma-glutamylphosphate reductase
MALPNGVCQPFVEALGESKSLIVDLSADYRFDNNWSYGLVESVKRSKIAQSTRIGNPRRYATGAQLALRPFWNIWEPCPQSLEFQVIVELERSHPQRATSASFMKT